MTNLKRQTGIALIEAMVALLVFSLGMLAITKFNAYVVGSTGLTKARAEATHMAQGKIEELRNRATQAQVNQLASGEDSPQGISTRFTRTWTVTAGDPIRIAVTVTWTGSDGKNENVTISSSYSWNNPTLSNLITDTQDGSGTGGSGPKRKPGPTGALRTATPADQAKVPSGTKRPTFVGNTGYVVDEKGIVRYVLDPNADGTARQFSWIRGRVYFDDTLANNKKKNSACSRVALSSAGYCYTNPEKLSDPLFSTNGNKFKYYEYECVTAEGWYGSVFLQFGDFHSSCGNNEDAKILACVGDPAYNNNTFTAAPFAIGSARRKYYGFKPFGSDFTNVGVAEGTSYPESGKPKPSAIGITYGSGDYLRHHFIISDTGEPNCKTVLEKQPSEFARNAGPNVCIDPIAGTTPGTSMTGSCPMTWPGWPSYAIGGGGETSATNTGGGSCTNQSASIISPFSPANNVQITIASGATGTCQFQVSGVSNVNCTYTSIVNDAAVKISFKKGGDTVCACYKHSCSTNMTDINMSTATAAQCAAACPSL